MTDGELSVQLLDANGQPVPIAGVHLDVRFYVDGRFRYLFSLGRTDAQGACRTSPEEIERQLEANRRFFIMDYNTPLMDCDREVGIAAPTAGELAEREAFRAKWWPEEPTMYGGAANDCMRCPEQKFELKWGTRNAINLICEVAAGA